MSERFSRRTGDLLVEATAIVASILLAFAIDAWWDERQLRAEEQDVLYSLQEEFRANKAQVTDVLDRHLLAHEVISSFLAMQESELAALNPSEISQIISFFAHPRTFDPVRGSLDALLGSGKLGLLRDRALREALTNFTNLLEDAVEDRQYLTDTSLQVWYEMARMGGPWRRPVSNDQDVDCSGPDPHRSCFIDQHLQFLPQPGLQDLVRLRDNETLMGYVKQHRINAVRYASEVTQIGYQVDRVLERIDENLD